MGKTGHQSSKVYLRSATVLLMAFFFLLFVSCGGGSNSTPPNTGPLSLSSSTLQFAYTINQQANPAPQNIQVTSTSGTDMAFSATTDVVNPNWLDVLPNNGNTPGTITVTALPKNLNKGTYTGHVIVTGTNSRATATVTLTVTSTTDPMMDVSPTSLSFTAVQGGSDPSPQLFSVKNDNPSSTPSDLQFTLASSTDSGGNWLGACVRSVGDGSTCQNTGVATTSVSVEPHIGSLAPGTYTGKVTVSASSTVNSPTTVNVTLTVQ